MQNLKCVLLGMMVMFLASPLLMGVERAPDKAVVLDFSWLTPPLITPDSAWGNVVRIDDSVRLISRAGGTSPSFTWTLRYPISSDQYPVLVLKYRSSAFELSGAPVLTLGTGRGGMWPVVSAADLVQDGSVRAIRRDLRDLPPGSLIARLHFVLPAASAQFDVVEVALETLGDAVPASVPMRQYMQFAIFDQDNRPLEGAIVRAGPLERRNWSTEGRTDAGGRVSLSVISPAAPGVAHGMLGLVEHTEAAIVRDGYAAQYVSSIPMGSSEVVSVAMSRGREVPVGAELPPSVAPASYEPQEYVYSPREADDYYARRDYYDPYYYGGGYYPYGYYSGYVVVTVKDHHGRHDGQDGRDHHGEKGKDRRTAALDLPPGGDIMGPWPGQTSVASRGVTTVPRYGVTTAPRYGVVTAPRYGVITAPSQRITTVPRQGITTAASGRFDPPAAPAQRVVSSPRNEVVRSPSRVSPAPRSVISRPTVMSRPPQRSMSPSPRQQRSAAPAPVGPLRVAPAPASGSAFMPPSSLR